MELASKVDGYLPFLWTGSFVSIPSFPIVVASTGLTYAKKDKYGFYELGAILKQDMTLVNSIGILVSFSDRSVVINTLQ